MRLSDQQKRKLFIAGTVALPPPFPQLGEIWIEREGVEFCENTEYSSRVDVLCVRTSHEPFWSVERRVLLSDVAAVFIPTDPDATEIDLARGEFILGADLKCRSDVPEKHDPNDTPWRGIVFVPENARVLISSETAMTAADSLHYYPTGACRCDCQLCPCDCQLHPCDRQLSPCDCQCRPC